MGFSLIRKKGKLAKMTTSDIVSFVTFVARCHLSSLVVFRCHSLYLDVSLVCLFINDQNFRGFLENLFEYCFLNIIVTVNFVSDLNISVSTTLKYYHNEALNKKLKLMGGAMKYFSKNIQGREIFSSMFSWDTKFFWKICKTLRPPSYILITGAQLGGRREASPALFWKSKKSALISGKKALILTNLGLNRPFKM